jgi:hypothetical protein
MQVFGLLEHYFKLNSVPSNKTNKFKSYPQAKLNEGIQLLFAVPHH